MQISTNYYIVMEGDNVNKGIAETIKRELERGKIFIERKIIEKQQDEYAREKLKDFNGFILEIRELGEKPPKSGQKDECMIYRHKLDKLICIWRDELVEFLPSFTKDELREFIGREVKGGESRERCFDVALILAERDDPLSFSEIAKKARWTKSFAGLCEKSLNKTLSRVLKSLKRMGLIVKAKYYFRLFNLDESDKDSMNLRFTPKGEEIANIEKYLARILKEISNLKEVIDRMNKKLTKTTSYSNSFMHRFKKLSED